jgi:AcrR family transcriptional regulator
VGLRKQQIVETALELIAAHGIESVSAQRVADAIGLSQPAVFRHFSTKEALRLAVMDGLSKVWSRPIRWPVTKPDATVSHWYPGAVRLRICPAYR